MTVKEQILNQADQLKLKAKESLQNLKRVALSEAWKILQIAVASIVQIIENTASDLSGKEKKQIAIDFINGFYDSVFVVIDIPFVPPLVEPIIHRYIKMILMVMVSSSIDATVTIFRETGIFIKKGVQQ